ncbi:MAG: VOC family protein [Humibacillus sp.]|nr:VOC family protein [Humibacillus sp.]MDN5779255.1 VOC family protein [Humibacillus sp.]
MRTPILEMVTIDCLEPQAEAAFWAAMLGGEVTYADENYGLVKIGDRRLGFGHVDGFTAPAWPDPAGGKQFHLDLSVDDLEAACADAVDQGAVRPDHQPGDGWIVMLDPAGHPFCLTQRANWAQM